MKMSRGKAGKGRLYDTDGGTRRTPDPESAPISPETYERLLRALDSVYPGKWRRAVDVTPVAVVKTIDNEADALETIRRIEERDR